MATNILIKDNDFVYENGSMKVGFSDFQLFEAIIYSKKGEFKETPLLGVGIEDYLNSNVSEQEINNVISTALKTDGATIKAILASQNTNGTFDIKIDGNY